MHWASFDPFTIDDPFWQDKMGMPVANKEFLRALMNGDRLRSIRFFCADTDHVARLRTALDRIGARPKGRLQVLPQALAAFSLDREPVDVMHHGDFTFFMPYVIEWRNRLGPKGRFPVTGVTHSLDTVSLHTKFLQLLLAGPKPYDAVICTSRCAMEMVRRSFAAIREAFLADYGVRLPEPPQLVQIPLGLPDEWFQEGNRFEARRRLHIPDDHFVLLCLGRFSLRKKMDLAPLLECLAWMKSQREPECSLPPWTLILAGAGKKNDIRLVQEMVDRLGLHSHVVLAPNVNAEDKPRLYQAADVFCSLVDNYQETFGITLLEAMGQGLPIIATDFDGYKELVAHERTGFLVPCYASADHEPWDSLAGMLDPSMLRFYRAQKVSFDLDALVAGLARLARDPELRRHMGARARVRAGCFRWSSVFGLYQDLWRSLGDEARRTEDLGPDRRASRQLLLPSTSGNFGHYPSGELRAGSLLGVGRYGRSLRRPPWKPMIYGELNGLLDSTVLEVLTLELEQRDRSLEHLVQTTGQRFNLPTDVAILHIDWLLKHGLARVKKI